MKTLASILLVLLCFGAKSQSYPTFGPEIDVTINGLTFDAMEPFISPNATQLFFNNLNDGIDTKLYYANRVNDSTFTFVGELFGPNQPTPPHLDAVPDMDENDHFYWTSTRDYPEELHNLFHGIYDNGTVSNINRVGGNFNRDTPGWLVMDHGISLDGQYLYYNNARFAGDECVGPCETEIGIAHKNNDSTFTKLMSSDVILETVNDTNFIYYAPCISSDNLEFYYTRYLKEEITIDTEFEICVAVRNNSTEAFSEPVVLFSSPLLSLIEATSLTIDRQILYYHKRTVDSHEIKMRYRNNTVSDGTGKAKNKIFVYPNPSSGQFNIDLEHFEYLSVSIYNTTGQKIWEARNQTQIDVKTFSPGLYIVKVIADERPAVFRVVLK